MSGEKLYCADCRFWGPLRLDNERIREVPTGPWPDTNPAMACKRFPPTLPWGVKDEALQFGIVKHGKTFGDDWCGEHQSRPGK